MPENEAALLIQTSFRRADAKKAVQRKQEHLASRARDQTAFERREQQWAASDISTKKDGGGAGGSGLDGWAAKQS